MQVQTLFCFCGNPGGVTFEEVTVRHLCARGFRCLGSAIQGPLLASLCPSVRRSFYSLKFKHCTAVFNTGWHSVNFRKWTLNAFRRIKPVRSPQASLFSVTLYFLLLLLHRLSTLACSEGIWVYGYTGLLGQRRDNSEMGMRMGVRIKASADCVRGRPCGVEEWFSCRWIYVFSLCQMKAAEFGASCLTYRKLKFLTTEMHLLWGCHRSRTAFEHA